ncbi:uncharacterized protein LOC135494108 [Lineus longissimus]|uniref:uncharacterized protein LOC135494108 n=1 Tax=Lineus longissimus TaxID=88925 RepID=UPI00315D853E
MSMTSSPHDDVSVFVFASIIEACTKYVWMFVVTFGVPGNLIAIVISLQKFNRNSAACLYIAAMALADFLVLVANASCSIILFWVVKESTGELPLQICWYSTYTFGTISGLTLAQMSIDRIIATRFPLHAVRLCTTGRAKRTTAITYIVVIAVNIHVFFVYEKEGKTKLRDPYASTQVRF